MAYEKQTWACGDTITAEKLNHMEDGIAQGGVTIIEPTPKIVDGTDINGQKVYVAMSPDVSVQLKAYYIDVEPEELIGNVWVKTIDPEFNAPMYWTVSPLYIGENYPISQQMAEQQQLTGYCLASTEKCGTQIENSTIFLPVDADIQVNGGVL